ncbi:hypothetical protein [Burkholderia sp. PU8-34]
MSNNNVLTGDQRAALDLLAGCDLLTPIESDALRALLAAHPGQPEPRVALLYEHDDGRYAAVPTAEDATFTRGEPAWHRIGPVTVYGSAMAAQAGAAPPESCAAATDDDKLCAERYRYARDNIQEGHELPGGYWLGDTGDAWDKTIDAVRAGESQ